MEEENPFRESEARRGSSGVKQIRPHFLLDPRHIQDMDRDIARQTETPEAGQSTISSSSPKSFPSAAPESAPLSCNGVPDGKSNARTLSCGQSGVTRFFATSGLSGEWSWQ